MGSEECLQGCFDHYQGFGTGYYDSHHMVWVVFVLVVVIHFELVYKDDLVKYLGISQVWVKVSIVIQIFLLLRQY